MVGARRKIPGPQPIEETVGMIGIHHLVSFKVLGVLMLNVG